MDNGIEIEGLDQFQEYLQNKTITDQEEKAIVKKALQPMKEGLEKETPKGNTGKLSKIKQTITKEELATVGKLRLGAWWDVFQEFGTSQQKKNVGFFQRTVTKKTDETIAIIKKETIDKGD